MTYLRRIRNFKITSLNLDSFQFVAILLGALFFYFGYLARDASIPPFFTTFLALFFGGLLTLFVTGFVNGEIDKAKSDYNEKKKALEKDIEKLKGQIGDDSDYRFAQELEFLSILSQELGKRPVPFPIDKFCAKIRKLHNDGILDEELKHYPNDDEDRKIALVDLNKGFQKKNDGKTPFLQLIGEACRIALNIQDENAPDFKEKNKLAMPLYRHIKAYLKAWLVCSIKNEVIIQIEPFIQPKLDGISSYEDKETYIKTIQYIKDVALTSEYGLPYFSTPGSRKIVKDYLQKLILLLKGESTQTNKTTPQLSPPI